MLAVIDWNAVAGLSAAMTIALVIGGAIDNKIRKFVSHRRGDDEKDEKLWVAVFGKPENHPFPEIQGLGERMDNAERMLSVLIARTEENHGSSMKDQLNRICDYLGIDVPPVSQSQRVD